MRWCFGTVCQYISARNTPCHTLTNLFFSSFFWLTLPTHPIQPLACICLHHSTSSHPIQTLLSLIDSHSSWSSPDYRGYRVRQEWGPALEERLKKLVEKHIDNAEEAAKALEVSISFFLIFYFCCNVFLVWNEVSSILRWETFLVKG